MASCSRTHNTRSKLPHFLLSYILSLLWSVRDPSSDPFFSLSFRKNTVNVFATKEAIFLLDSSLFQEIHKRVMALSFRDCHTKIRHVDAHATLNEGVVVQVMGELSNNMQPMRKFMQTFVLAPEVGVYTFHIVWRIKKSFCC